MPSLNKVTLIGHLGADPDLVHVEGYFPAAPAEWPPPGRLVP